MIAHRIAGTVFIVAFLAGCSPSPKVTQFNGNTMGTTYEVTYVPNGKSVQQDEVEQLLAEINQSLSNYIGDSVISRLNASHDVTTWHPVDVHFEKVFGRARMVYEDTGGIFNPALGPLINAWGFGPADSQELPGDARIHELLAEASFDGFEFRDSPPSVRKLHAGAQLDFGGIAKGYGVDAVAGLLEGEGIADYLVKIAGEVRARGRRPDGRAWRVGIEKPADNALAAPKIQAVISLKDGSISTSGNYRNYRSEKGKILSHILNPLTGRPVETSLLSVSVLAADTMTADAYATSLMVMGLDNGLRFVESHKEMAAYFIARDDAGNIIEKRSSTFPEDSED